MRSDSSNGQPETEVGSLSGEENLNRSDQDFADISIKIENQISKQLNDTELGQNEFLRLIENISSTVDIVSNASFEQSCSAIRIEHNENTVEEVEEGSLSRNPILNIVKVLSTIRRRHVAVISIFTQFHSVQFCIGYHRQYLF